MSKEAKINSLLLLAILILSTIVWFEPGLEQPDDFYLSSLKRNDINTIIIERKDIEQIKLHKFGEQWYLQEPFYLPANKLRVDTITALANKRSFSRFQISESNLSRYQLDKPLVSVWLNNQQFLIGNDDPINQQRYVTHVNANIDSQKTVVHLIDGTIFYQLRSNLESFIDPHLVPPAAQITRIQWSNKIVEFNNNQWQITSPQITLSQEQLSRFVENWRHMVASRVETQLAVPLTNAQLQLADVIAITFNDQQKTQTIEYLIIQEKQQIKLVRVDLELAYWLSVEQLKLLTELK